MGDVHTFWNPDLPLQERVDDLVSRLTLEEKAAFVTSRQPAIERLGIKEWYVGCEIARGYVGRRPEEPSTVLPQPFGMAAMFDPELMYQLGVLAGNETRVYYQKDKKGRLMLFGPTVDMERDPRWGRNEEAYGEDPYLTGQMSIAYTKGLSGDDPFYLRTAPGLKHFCCNNNEHDRGKCSANIEPRTKHEYYYKAFRYSITEGGAISLMAAYNELSGVPGLLNPDLRKIVKNQWGLQFVVSDGADFAANITDHHYLDNHVESIALAIKAGADIMLDDADLVKWAVLEALKRGLLTEEELDESIKRAIAVRFRFGEFDPEERNPYARIPAELINCKEHKALNRRAAQEQVILLKNDGLLPLTSQKKKFAVIGPLADRYYMDWYTGYSDYAITVLDGLKQLVGDENILFDNAYDRVALKSKATGKYLSVKEDGTVIADAESVKEAELFEYHDWDFGSQNLWSVKNRRFLKEEDGIKATGETTYEWFVREWLRCNEYPDPQISGGKNLIIDTWNNLHVATNQDGKLTTAESRAITQERLFQKEIVSDGIERAVKLAADADIAIVCVGNDPLQVAREGYDRPDLVLPKHQAELIKAVHEANPRTVVVIISSYPYAVNWEKEHIPAMLFSSHAGPEMGHAIVDVLFGNYNPAGRTPMTWYKSVRDLPDIKDYDIIKNDMTYLYYKGEPLYPFGYGLSYSKFQYKDLHIETISNQDESVRSGNRALLRVSLTVENISDWDGDEVVQLYYRINNPRVKRPLRQLCGFRRIFIKAGCEVKVEFTVRNTELEFYDVTRDTFCVESGNYTFMAGSSCLDIRLQSDIYVDGDIIPPQTLRQLTPAINYDDKSGIQMRFCKELNRHYITVARDDFRSFVKFGTVDMTGADSLEVTASTAFGKAHITVYMDSLDSEPVGSLEIPITSGPTHFTPVSGKLGQANGVHDLYLVLEQGVSLLNLRIRSIS